MKDERIFTETATQVKSDCIFTKIAEMFWKRVGKLPDGHSISIVPSQYSHSALFVLGPICAEVAGYVAMRSLPCHMGSSYLARLTGN